MSLALRSASSIAHLGVKGSPPCQVLPAALSQLHQLGLERRPGPATTSKDASSQGGGVSLSPCPTGPVCHRSLTAQCEGQFYHLQPVPLGFAFKAICSYW